MHAWPEVVGPTRSPLGASSLVRVRGAVLVFFFSRCWSSRAKLIVSPFLVVLALNGASLTPPMTDRAVGRDLLYRPVPSALHTW